MVYKAVDEGVVYEAVNRTMNEAVYATQVMKAHKRAHPPPRTPALSHE